MDAESVSGRLLPSGSVYAFLAAHRRELFPDAMFADLFPSSLGRPSVPADVVAAVLVLQALEGRSDREAVEALTFDLRWKGACGLPITAAGFHPTVLTYWRRRLAASGRPNRIFDVVREVVAATGALSGKTRRALDSTVLEDAVATQDTVVQLIAAIRRVRRGVPGAPEVVAAHCTAHDYDDPGKPAIAWNDPEARAALVDALVTDAHRLLGHLPEQQLGPRPAEAVALLALVAGQDVEPVKDSDGTDGRWQMIARRVAADRFISTVDPDARHAHKTVSRRTDGFTAHVVVEPDTGLITAARLTAAAGAANSDATVGIALLAEDDSLAGPVQVLADSAYGTGDGLAALAAAGHTPVIKPWPQRPAVPGGFTIDDFTVDEAAGAVTCPAGITRPISRTRAVTFGVACHGCRMRERCTTAADGRTLRLHEHDAIQRAHRARAADPDFQAIYRRHRPMVERSIAWLTRGHRRVPYRGVANNNAWLHLRVAAINLRRLINLGLTDTNRCWALSS